MRIGGRSASSDVELADFESDFSAANREAYHEDVSAPKHKRARVTQVKARRKTLFLCQLHAPFHNFLLLLYAMKCSTMHTLFFGVTGGQTPWGCWATPPQLRPKIMYGTIYYITKLYSVSKRYSFFGHGPNFQHFYSTPVSLTDPMR